MDWLDRAACGDEAPELFDDLADPVPALLVCAHCPVLAECHAWTVAHRPAGVVQGGLVFGERVSRWCERCGVVPVRHAHGRRGVGDVGKLARSPANGLRRVS